MGCLIAAAAVESAPPPAHVWLLLCRGEPALAAAAYSTTYDTPAGARNFSIVSRDAPAPDLASPCTTLRLPVDAKEVVWAPDVARDRTPRREVAASGGSASRAEWVTPCGRRS